MKTPHLRSTKHSLLALLAILPAFTSGQCCAQEKPPKNNQAVFAKVPPRQIVPMDVQQRAKAATQVMVDQVMVGKYAEVIEMMNPDYLKKTATQKRITVTKLKEQLAKQLETIGKNGVTLDATITRAPKGAFEVDYGFEEEIINGKKVKVANYRSWMVFIPTVTDLQVLDNHQESPTLKRYRKFGFQVAISPKKGEKWTFIGGSGVNALELRKLFPYLPKTDKEFDFPVRKIVERPAKK